jgi:hypothetical protein
VLPTSGNATTGFIQFQSFPGENAIIDGTGVAMPQATKGIATGLVQIANRDYIILSGFEVRNWKANSASFFPAGMSVTGAGTHIELRHNRIHAIANPNPTAGQSLCGGDPENCGANGLAVYGTNGSSSVNNLVIDGNELFNLILGQSESMTLDGNVASWWITNNIVHDNNNIGIDAIGFEGVSPNFATDQARSGVISGNLVYNINDKVNPAYPPNYSAGGIYVDGGSNILIERNISHNNNLGIELASEHCERTTSHVIARNNLVYFNSAPGISIGGFTTPTGCSGTTCTKDSTLFAGSTDHCTITNNSLLFNDSTPNDGSGEFQIQFFPKNGVFADGTTATGNVFDNNILYANNQDVLTSNPFASPQVALDFNLYFTPDGDANSTWQFDNQTFMGFSNYTGSTGQDQNSAYANPLYLSLTPPQLFVEASSPAVNNGNCTSTCLAAVVGTEDHAGFARVQGSAIDIGAYEQP